ncbi:MAG: hypothetical protein K0S65_5813, partial [Labilithrix sp.]|nr:hypothetical protein [Labilithrix sp.]
MSNDTGAEDREMTKSPNQTSESAAFRCAGAICVLRTCSSEPVGAAHGRLYRGAQRSSIFAFVSTFAHDGKVSWVEVPVEEAMRDYSVDAISADGFGEVFPEEPAHYFVHKGDVVIDGAVSFGAGDDVDVTLHVIDGNLTVNGPLFFIQGDFYGALYVTGS